MSTTTGLPQPGPVLAWRLWLEALEKMERYVERENLRVLFQFSLFVEGGRKSVGAGEMYSFPK